MRGQVKGRRRGSMRGHTRGHMRDQLRERLALQQLAQGKLLWLIVLGPAVEAWGVKVASEGAGR